MIRRILKTDKCDMASFVARLALGIMIFPHGAQKVFGWYGGNGFEKTMDFFTQTMGIPSAFGFLAIAAEFLGGIGLITGTLTRLSAFGIGITMAVAVYMVHFKNGFFMNWSGSQMGEGFEFHLLAVGLAITLIIRGGGFLSVDSFLTSKCFLAKCEIESVESNKTKQSK